MFHHRHSLNFLFWLFLALERVMESKDEDCLSQKLNIGLWLLHRRLVNDRFWTCFPPSWHLCVVTTSRGSKYWFRVKASISLLLAAKSENPLITSQHNGVREWQIITSCVYRPTWKDRLELYRTSTQPAASRQRKINDLLNGVQLARYLYTTL